MKLHLQLVLFLLSTSVGINALSQSAFAQDRGSHHHNFRFPGAEKREAELSNYFKSLESKIYSKWQLEEGVEQGKITVLFKVSKTGFISSSSIVTSSGDANIDASLLSAMKKVEPIAIPNYLETELTLQMYLDANKKFRSLPVTARSCYMKAAYIIKTQYFDSLKGFETWKHWSKLHQSDLNSPEDAAIAIEQMIANLNDPASHLIRQVGQFRFPESEGSDTKINEMTKARGYSLRLSEVIGYMRPNEFTHRSIDEWSYELMNIEGSKYLILDLRNNRGGIMPPIRRIASMFLEENLPIYKLKKSHSTENILADRDMLTFKGKTVVLVNELTTAESEIIAASLRDNKGAIIVGTKTRGCGQQVTYFDLPYLFKLVLTTSEALTPKNQKISDGLVPNISVSLSSEQIRTGKGPWWSYCLNPDPFYTKPSRNDIQLNKALEVFSK